MKLRAAVARLVLPHPPGAGAYGRLLDVRLVREEAPDGAFEVEMRVDDRHANVEGVTHGGVAMGLLDVAMAGAIRRTLAPGEGCASVNLNADFLRPAPPGRLLARGRVDRRGATMAFASGEVLAEDGKAVARGTGVWVVRVRRPS